jgi:hypothetical protein
MIKSQQNIKIEYQVLNDKKITMQEQSVFILENDLLSDHTNFKISSLEKDILNTYITALCEDESQKIIDINEEVALDEKKIYFDSKHSIVLQNDKINKYKEFYNNSTIDYLLSPFIVLQSIINENPCENSLNLFILNDNIYSIILNNEKRIMVSNVTKLTSFKDIKNSNFYNDEIVEQKLYDEIYMLELNETISNISKEYYSNHNNASFIEVSNIYYNIKQLNDEQLLSLNEMLMIKINYESVALEEILFELTKKPSTKKSNFIEMRPKKKPISMFILVVSFLLSSILAAGIFYYLQNEQKETTQEPMMKKEVMLEKIEELMLPDHKKINMQMINLLKSLFHSIPDNAVLKELQILKDESTVIYNYKEKGSYQKYLKTNLEKIYEKSENILTSQNKSIFTAIVSNTTLLNKVNSKLKAHYSKDDNYATFTDVQTQEYIKTFFNKETQVKQLSKVSLKNITYKFSVSTIINSTQELLSLIEKINENNYSIVLQYPIELIKIKEGIEVNLFLKFHLEIEKKVANISKPK